MFPSSWLDFPVAGRVLNLGRKWRAGGRLTLQLRLARVQCCVRVLRARV